MGCCFVSSDPPDARGSFQLWIARPCPPGLWYATEGGREFKGQKTRLVKLWRPTGGRHRIQSGGYSGLYEKDILFKPCECAAPFKMYSLWVTHANPFVALLIRIFWHADMQHFMRWYPWRVAVSSCASTGLHTEKRKQSLQNEEETIKEGWTQILVVNFFKFRLFRAKELCWILQTCFRSHSVTAVLISWSTPVLNRRFPSNFSRRWLPGTRIYPAEDRNRHKIGWENSENGSLVMAYHGHCQASGHCISPPPCCSPRMDVRAVERSGRKRRRTWGTSGSTNEGDSQATTLPDAVDGPMQLWGIVENYRKMLGKLSRVISDINGWYFFALESI